MGSLMKYSKLLVPAVVFVVGMVSKAFGLDIAIGEADGTTIVTSLAMLVGVFLAPKNKE